MESTAFINDMRNSPRYPIDARAKINFTREGFQQRVTVKVNDIGVGGVAIISPVALPVGSNVEFEIMLPGTRVMMRLVAAIRHQKGQRYGVEFLSATDSQKSEITNFGKGRQPATHVMNNDAAQQAAS